ncbi:MAG: NAD(P)-dependent oxidoreductase [Phycisphaerae bacterium]|jgi:nucleoside-diphosphate-sugar epimerase
MRIAVTGATGFLGRYIVNLLLERGHHCRCWHRPDSDCEGIEDVGGRLAWLPGELGEPATTTALVQDCAAVVHAALYHPGGGFRGGEGDVVEFVQRNVVGTIQLIEAARAAGVRRFIFISTCAVHERILDDRVLDENHPLFPTSHYGAHKAAIEKFIASYGLGLGYDICALRPTGIYGLAQPVMRSKWFDLVRRVVRGERVEVDRGGKEVHVTDVAQAVEVLLEAEGIAGQAYNCYDRYICEYDVAATAKEIAGSDADIVGERRAPLNEIETHKIEALGVRFGGWTLFEQYIGNLVEAIQAL